MSALPVDLFGEPALALAELAAAINVEHAAAERTIRKAIEHAKAAGDSPARQGASGAWAMVALAVNELSGAAMRTAQSLRVPGGHPETLEGKCATVAYLPINDALALLNAPEPDSDPITGDLPTAPTTWQRLAHVSRPDRRLRRARKPRPPRYWRRP